MQKSAIPPTYFAVFGYFEPMLTTVGFLSAVYDPKKTHDGQAPWPNDIVPEGVLPRASLVTILQLAHVCGLLGVINWFVLSAAKKHLASQPALQEKIVQALLIPLTVADITHLLITLVGMGDSKWDFARWSTLAWSTWILGLMLFVPRVLWHMGIGRYVHSRDRASAKQS